MGNIAQVIKYEGDNKTFIWKHPLEDFNSGSQLIVHESQEAIFFLNGQALDLFGPGRHTLETQNIPILRRLINIPTDGETPFHCEVYFINKTEQMAIKWGTDTKMEYVEPVYGFPIQIGACGEMNVAIDDGRKLLIKVVGTERTFYQQDLVQKFRSFLMTKVKPYIVTLIRENKLNIFQIDERLQDVSVALHEALKPDFQEYGLSLTHFFVMNISKPEDDKNYRRFKELHFRQYADIAEAKLRQQVSVIDQETAAKRMVIEAQGLAQKRSLEGYTYQDERGFDVAERIASNQAVGEFTNMGVGLGMITGVGGTIGNAVGGMMSNTVNKAMDQSASAPAAAPAPAMKCQCGASLHPNAKFCLECGKKVEVAAEENDKIVCPKCNAKVSKGKFCLECGASLVNQCTSCNAELPQGAKFCFVCGTKVN